MRSSPALYPAVEILHILGFVVLVGSILALDLRLLGWGRAIPIAPMAQLLLPLSRFGFLLAISMGFLLFSADAAHVVRNPAFQSKLLLIAAALLNIAIAHAGLWRHVALWPPMSEAQPHRRFGIPPQPNTAPTIVGIARSAPTGLLPPTRMERCLADPVSAARRIQATATVTAIIPMDAPPALIEIKISP